VFFTMPSYWVLSGTLENWKIALRALWHRGGSWSLEVTRLAYLPGDPERFPVEHLVYPRNSSCARSR